MHDTVPGNAGHKVKKTVYACVLVEAEVQYCCIITSGGDEHLVHAIDMVAITGDIQAAVKGMADHSPFSAGDAKAPGCAPGSRRLPYYFGLSAQEKSAIALITDKVTERTGEAEERILFSHKRLF
jgi:hypothetical protein